MDKRVVKEAPLRRESHGPRFWAIYRSPVFLVSLVAGLVMFLIWLPGAPRATLIAALLAQRVLLGMLFVFALVVVSLVWSAGQRLDAWVFLFFNLRGYHSKWLDYSMWLGTQLGNMLTAFFLAALFFELNYRRLTVEIILGILTLWIMVETIKALTARARPFLDLVGARVIGWRQVGRSFPSGHTSQAFFLTTLLSHRFQFDLGTTILLYALAAFVGYTRMYVGAHYPRDVIGGAALGAIWGVLAALVDPYWFGFGLR